MIKNGKCQKLFCVRSFALSQYTGQNTTFGPCIRNMWYRHGVVMWYNGREAST